MSNKYSVEEAFRLFKDYGITSNIAVVRRWIRNGEIKAKMEKRQSGYEIEAKEVQRFIEEKSLIYWRNKSHELERENKKLMQALSDIENNKKVSRGTSSNITLGDIDDTISNITYSYNTEDDINEHNLMRMRRDDMRLLCREKKIKGYWKMSKKEMVKALLADMQE